MRLADHGERVLTPLRRVGPKGLGRFEPVSWGVALSDIAGRLRDIEGEQLLKIHADDAAARGITSGSVVTVFNQRGHYRCKAKVSARARPGVVNGLGLWWRKLGLDGSNVNELTSQLLTDLGRSPVFYDCLVQVQAGAPN